MSKQIIYPLAALAMLGAGAVASVGHAETPGITLAPLGSYREPTATTGVCRRNISEIGAYDPLTRRLFVTNYADNSIDIFDIRHPESIKKPDRIKLSELPGVNDANLTPTSVAVRFPLVAVAAESISPVTGPGKLLILGINGRLLRSFDVGSGPDMVTFTPDERYVLAAVEGEPVGTADPTGSVAILDLRRGVWGATLRTADFKAFDGQEDLWRDREVRITPNTPFSQDAEPEFIAVSHDSRTAYVTLQENNAIAVVDIKWAEVTDILPLGLKNHSLPGAGFDGSRDDKAINIANWPVFGSYQPDGIAAFKWRGVDFLVTANEGDARNGDGDIVEVRNLNLDTTIFPNAAVLKTNAQLGRLEVSNLPQDTRPNNAGEATRLVSFGGRSFSIWDSSGHLVFDSGDDFERKTAAATPAWFNTQDDDLVFDRRSPKRGPEPEGAAVGTIQGRTYAFIGLERHSGIMVYDVTNPHEPAFQGYFNHRDFGVSPNAGDSKLIRCVAGNLDASDDLGPEGILFIPAPLSPTFRPLLVVNYETSGSIRIFSVDRREH